jgi:hypothetical protein
VSACRSRRRPLDLLGQFGKPMRQGSGGNRYAIAASLATSCASRPMTQPREELCRQAAANTRAAFDVIETDPCPTPPTSRQHPLKGSLSIDTYSGRTLAQWQYEVTAGGRVWYLVDHETHICWIKHAGTGHPNKTD